MSHTETFYICDATGNTWPIKEDLKKLGFKWDKAMSRWSCMAVSERERGLFTMKVQSGAWKGVTLQFHSMRKEETPF